MRQTVFQADCLDWLTMQPDDSVDLIFTSPPYEAARTYGIGFALRDQEWVNWAVARYVECVRISRGLVAWVVEGQTRKFRWSATPALLMADLHRAGIKLRKPPAFARVGIPGSGGPDWIRNDYEFIICATKGRLPWSDNTAMGHLPRWAIGGAMSNRTADGSRQNGAGRKPWGQSGKLPKTKNGDAARRLGHGNEKGGCKSPPPALANPGNVIRVNVGGGVMGSRLVHENEAPFPESLAEFFIRSFCPLGGLVLDPFCGSGTTLAVAAKTGRNAIGIDVRESQVKLTRRRLAEVQRELI